MTNQPSSGEHEGLPTRAGICRRTVKILDFGGRTCGGPYVLGCPFENQHPKCPFIAPRKSARSES